MERNPILVGLDGQGKSVEISMGGLKFLRVRRKTIVEVAAFDAILLLLTYLVFLDEQWRFACALGQEPSCIARSDPSYSYSVLTQFFSMKSQSMMLLGSPPVLDWTQVFALLLVVVNVWFLSSILRKRSSTAP